MQTSDEWTIGRRALLRRLHAAAIAVRDRPPQLQLTCTAPGLGGALGELLEDLAEARAERARRFLLAEQQTEVAQVWERVEAIFADVDDVQGVELAPSLFLATPETLGAASVLQRAELYVAFDRNLADDELVLLRTGRRVGEMSLIHVSPNDLALDLEQDWYCRLRCEGTPANVAANIVRLALRS